MKTVLIVVGVLALFCCGIVGSCAYIGMNAYKKITGEAKAYGDESIKAIAQKWDPKELESRADAEFKKSTDEKGMEAFVAKLKVLGPVKSIADSSVTQFNIEKAGTEGDYTQTTYNATVDFEKASKAVTMTLRKREAGWQIHNIDVR